MLGGPIGIYEIDRYPFIKDELAVIEAAVKKGVPVIGICLGCQALAAVLAARVYPGKQKELGWDEMTLTAEGKASPLGAIDGVRVLNWHGDTFDLPVGATRLASTAITPNQAFTYGPKVLALQFHVELPQRDMERWLIGHTLELATSKVDLAQDARRDRALRPAANAASQRLFNDWLDGRQTLERRFRAGSGRWHHRLAGRRRQVAGVGRLGVVALGVPPGRGIAHAAAALGEMGDHLLAGIVVDRPRPVHDPSARRATSPAPRRPASRRPS